MSDDRPNVFGRAGQLASRVYPHVDRDLWLARRRLSTHRARKDLDHFASGLHFGPDQRADDLHLIVVAHHGPDALNWHIAGGNIFFEVYQSALEVLGSDRVTLFHVAKDEPTMDWQRRLLVTVAEAQATHVIAQVEADPNQAGLWNWDVVLPVLSEHWHGAIIGMMYDSAYEWLRIRAHRLGRQTNNLLYVELCEPMSNFVRAGQYEVGPITMPQSQATVAAIDAYVKDLPKAYDVSFIGALYDYRVELLDALRGSGLVVAENPHRSDAVANYEESRTNQPTYLDYMAGLAQSEMTINFSLAHGGPHEQYKIRVHEASLVGCLCLTDDGDRTRHFFAPNEFQFFPSVEALPRVIETRLGDRETLRRDQDSARSRAHELALTDYWGRIDDGLRRRGLRALTGLIAPAEPM